MKKTILLRELDIMRPTKNYRYDMARLLFLIILFSFGRTSAQNIITTVAGNGTASYSGDNGFAISAGLNGPKDLVLDTAGNIYFCDGGNNRVRKISTSGIITTIAGNGTVGFNGDGGLATAAQLNAPLAIAIDDSGSIYIADYGNCCIRKVNITGIISTVVGSTCGFSGDNGQATSAQMYAPIGITFDTLGNLYIADYANSRVRKVNPSGIITTIAGNGIAGYNGDNIMANTAELNYPARLWHDKNGNLFIADYANERIRKINSSGIITTIAGIGTFGYSGDNNLATLAQLGVPWGIVTDAAGNIYFCDSNNNVVRKINASGIITTIVGNGFGAGLGGCSGGFSGDNGAASLAELSNNGGLAFDNSGNLYISDNCNHRIRKVTNVVGISKVTNINIQISIFPNPTTDQFIIETTTFDKLTVDLYDINGRHVFNANVSDKSNINVATLNEGIYTLTIKTFESVVNKKLVIIR